MRIHQAYFPLILLFVASTAMAITKSDVVLFKGDQKGTLHLILEKGTAPGKAAIALNNQTMCGDVSKVSASATKTTTQSGSNADPECKPTYTSAYRFSKTHKFTDREIPLAIGFNNCSVSFLRDNAVFPSEKLMNDFKKDNSLPQYVSHQAKVFSGEDGSKYLSFIGMVGETTKSKNPDLYKFELSGTVKRDFFLYDLSNKKFVLNKREQVCCDPKEENVYLCNLPKQAESACFDPYRKLENIVGLAKDQGKLYAFNVTSVNEGVRAYVSELADNEQKDVFSQSFYALEGCR